MKVFVVAICLCVLIVGTTALRCQPCTKSPYRCPNNARPEDCPYGIVTDMCDCCYVCGKGPKESCGGPFNFDGKCGTCLTCVPPPGHDVRGFRGGTCQKTNEVYTDDLKDEYFDSRW